MTRTPATRDPVRLLLVRHDELKELVYLIFVSASLLCGPVDIQSSTAGGSATIWPRWALGLVRAS